MSGVGWNYAVILMSKMSARKLSDLVKLLNHGVVMQLLHLDTVKAMQFYLIKEMLSSGTRCMRRRTCLLFQSF